MDQDTLEKILGREEHKLLIAFSKKVLLPKMKEDVILITGGNGSLGNALADWFDEAGVTNYHLLDINLEKTKSGRRIHKCDITDYEEVAKWVRTMKPTLIIHFAASKHAPDGEENPENVIDININGTLNIVKALEKHSPETKLVLASTCKSCMPETCYGASKLISERLVLNFGGSVARYFNVVQSSGNVFEIWNNTDTKYVTPCFRYFISLNEAVALAVNSSHLTGRFIISPGEARFMPDIARDLFGDEAIAFQEPRRGDRVIEPLCGSNEDVFFLHDYLCEVRGTHDG